MASHIDLMSGPTVKIPEIKGLQADPAGESSTPEQEAAGPAVANNLTDQPLSHYSEEFAQADPVQLSQRSGVRYDESRCVFTFVLTGSKVELHWPDAECVFVSTQKQVPAKATILLLRLVTNGCVTPSRGEWISYGQVPWGQTYLQQFTEKNIKRLTRMFPTASHFAHACRFAGGVEFKSSADASFEIEFLEGLGVRLLFWEADDEFDAQAQILFSDNMPAAFSAEDLSQLATILLNRLRQA